MGSGRTYGPASVENALHHQLWRALDPLGFDRHVSVCTGKGKKKVWGKRSFYLDAYHPLGIGVEIVYWQKARTPDWEKLHLLKEFLPYFMTLSGFQFDDQVDRCVKFVRGIFIIEARRAWKRHHGIPVQPIPHWSMHLGTQKKTVLQDPTHTKKKYDERIRSIRPSS